MPTFHDPDEASDPLTSILLRAVPKNEHGAHTVTHMAKLMNVTRAGLYKWVSHQKLPPERAMQIVEISRIEGYDEKKKPILGEARVRREELDQFVYRAS